ncbi:hybrid sensor histidine kinase/response regulator transcription factor [Seonamhaeicola aphaedonensis]|uniref:histidine kinase n=1 Tax=Seonamhaeicola aphaedonensis TaxID=1461338 RepID=A0A3D9HKV2_9FLAO|nr:two-component regulator propeller domain-containing protein [Seonamhaeicola aphaedonensis]RED50104.1 signal transduction histidine kinase [Seonamhaeicola aphaedonensis]
MILSIRKFYFTVFFLLIYTSMFSQWRLHQTGAEEGLSHNRVTSIIQDKNGYLWFATLNGVNKYDGYSMKLYNYGVDDKGLSSSVILKLFEDKDGYIWVGTIAGLNRINPDTGIINTYFETGANPVFTGKNSIYQSESGIFFIDSLDGIKLFEIDNQGKLKYEFFLNKYGGFKLDIKNIKPSANGKFWFLTPSKTVKLHQIDIVRDGTTPKLSIDATDYTESLFDSERTALDILEYPNNTLWIVNEDLELLKIKLNDNLKVIESKTINLKNSIALNQLKEQRLVNMSGDKEGRIWIAGNGLLLNYNDESGEIQNLSKNKQLKNLIDNQDIQKIFIDNSNVLWLCALTNGLFKMDLESHSFYNSTEYLSTEYSSQLFKSQIVTLCEDKKGNFWFGTQKGIIAGLDKNIFRNNVSSTSVSPIIYLDSISDIKKNKATFFPEVKRLISDREGAIWVGALNGLFKIDYNETSKTYNIKEIDGVKDYLGNKIDSRVFAIEEDRKGNIWFGPWEKGLIKMSFNKETNSYYTTNYNASLRDSTSLSSNNIRDILEDQQGNIWVGTVDGLNKLNRSSTGEVTFEKFYSNPENQNTLSSSHILDIHQAKNGDLYFGTYGGGLNCLSYSNKNDFKFTNYTVENGLPSNVVTQVKEDFKGNIWSIHTRQISKLNPSTGKIIYFEKEDGFDVDQFVDNAMEFTKSGMMICGGVGGFTFFYPNNLTVNSQKPQVTLTDFKLFNKPVGVNEEVDGKIILNKGLNETEKIVLPHHLNSFEFEFSSMHFSNPKKNRYKFVLEGFEENSHNTIGQERKFASYTNVPPGDYIFKVYGSNSSSVWSDVPKEIMITITPPWYLTTTAIVFFVLLLGVIGFIVNRVRWNQIKLKNQIKLESALHEKSEEMNQMKLRFFTNISHELRTPLTLIIGPLQQIMEGSNDTKYLQRLNAIMYKNSTRLLKLINQLLDFRSAESGNVNLIVEEGNLVSFLTEIYNAFKEIAAERQINFKFKSTKNSIQAWFDNDKIEKVVYNLLSNAFKFTSPGKSITLILDKESIDGKECAIIKVVDEGIGIASDDLSSVFERFYQIKKESNSIQTGSGLGLAYTKRLIEIHKGNIFMDSTVGKGTTCTVSFPISKGEYEDDAMLEIHPKQYNFSFVKKEVKDFKSDLIEPPKAKIKVEYTKETPTLLIVEDNTDLREYLSNYFENYYKVISAKNGQEGLDFALKMGPDIIISDLMMPIMNGVEMCKIIKNDINTSHIPVIILTAKLGIENEKEGLEAGADEFVLKPFNMEILRLRVNNILKTKQQWAEKFKTKSTPSSWKELSSKLDKNFLKKSFKFIDKNIDNSDYSVEKFSLDIGMSRSALHKKIKSITGQSTSEFIRTIRIKRAATLIRSGQYSITEVVFMVGFSDTKYFRTCFKKQFGQTPSEYVKSFKL